jgi:1,4-dihydroxy-2-naphthoyl-CoA synthase
VPRDPRRVRRQQGVFHALLAPADAEEPVAGARDDDHPRPGLAPDLEMYEAIEKCQKPVIASVNGFAVGGGNVLQMLCDLGVAEPDLLGLLLADHVLEVPGAVAGIERAHHRIEKCQKPVIASVNGFAVGGGNVLQMLCDCTVAKQSAVFRHC